MPSDQQSLVRFRIPLQYVREGDYFADGNHERLFGRRVLEVIRGESNVSLRLEASAGFCSGPSKRIDILRFV
jgi:hypothetical protein